MSQRNELPTGARRVVAQAKAACRGMSGIPYRRRLARWVIVASKGCPLGMSGFPLQEASGMPGNCRKQELLGFPLQEELGPPGMCRKQELPASRFSPAGSVSGSFIHC
jgi:hypothetical protein